MALPIPRLHFYEIDDQSWFPSFLREKVQACLTLLWKSRFPPFQSIPPASHVVRALQSRLGPSIKDYTYIDFCSGAGGPTPLFEREINRALELESIETYHANHKDGSATTTIRRKDATTTPQTANGTLTTQEEEEEEDNDPSVDFILTDLFPHIPSWSLACSRRPHLHYIPRPINACSTPPDLLSLIQKNPPAHHHNNRQAHQQQPIPHRKPFHLFSLAFHHFPDPLARLVLRNALLTSSGFAIFELQSRTLGSLFTVLCMGPLLMGISWYYFWGDWTHLFFTYVVPVVPFVVVFDGLVSCLRTRTRGEVLRLMDEVEGVEEGWRVGWKFESGKGVHTWPRGEVSWFLGVKEE
ncbi:MAG: hypothetical protein Q9219_000847 [cf. Caloplaca sp. 3 TL-2023]